MKGVKPSCLQLRTPLTTTQTLIPMPPLFWMISTLTSTVLPLLIGLQHFPIRSKKEAHCLKHDTLLSDQVTCMPTEKGHQEGHAQPQAKDWGVLPQWFQQFQSQTHVTGYSGHHRLQAHENVIHRLQFKIQTPSSPPNWSPNLTILASTPSSSTGYWTS